MDNMTIEKLRNDIFRNYRPERYQRDTGDLHFRYVPNRLRKLWYGETPYSLCFRNMDYYCKICRQGEMPAIELIKQLSDLRDALALEFERIDISKVNRKETCHD